MKEIVEKLDIIKISNFLLVKGNVKINEDIRHTIGADICRRHYLRDTKNTTIKKPYRWLKKDEIFEVHFERQRAGEHGRCAAAQTTEELQIRLMQYIHAVSCKTKRTLTIGCSVYML